MTAERILLLGGTGFLGRRVLTGLLVRKPEAEVRVLVHSSRLSAGYEGLAVAHDDLQAVVAFEPTHVVNLAAGWSSQGASPGAEVRANLELPVRILAALLDTPFAHGGTWLQGGSYFQLSSQSTNYIESKRTMTGILRTWSDMAGFSQSTLILPHLTGPGEDARRFLPSLISTLAQGEVFEMTEGLQQVPLLHVEDAAEAVVRCVAAPSAPQLIGVTPVWYGDLRTLALDIAAAMGAQDLLRVGARPTPADTVVEVVDFPPPIEGWSPKIPYAEIIQQARETS